MAAWTAVLVGATLATVLAGSSEAEGLTTGKGEALGATAQHGAQTDPDPVKTKEKDCVNDALPPGTIIRGKNQQKTPQDS